MRQVEFFIAAMLTISGPVLGQDSRVVDEYEIEAGIDSVWHAFTTSEGLQSWVSPLADIDFRVGGKWRANYNKDGELGDATTIENTVLSYDPKRMLSIKATGFPEGFEFVEAAKTTWSVFYFAALTDAKTKITVVGLGYSNSEESQKLLAFFKPANRYSMDQLKAALEKPLKKQPE